MTSLSRRKRPNYSSADARRGRRVASPCCSRSSAGRPPRSSPARRRRERQPARTVRPIPTAWTASRAVRRRSARSSKPLTERPQPDATKPD